MRKMKLVRDQIPEIIQADGSWCLTRTANGDDELIAFLKLKMLEEVDEFINDPCLEEAADMFEVFRELCARHELLVEDVIYAAAKKRSTNGGFSNGIILQKIGEK